MQYFGHIMRHCSMQRDILVGKLKGHRGRGRPRRMWTDGIKEWTGLQWWELKEAVLDRNKWRSMIANLWTGTAHERKYVCEKDSPRYKPTVL